MVALFPALSPTFQRARPRVQRQVENASPWSNVGDGEGVGIEGAREMNIDANCAVSYAKAY